MRQVFKLFSFKETKVLVVLCILVGLVFLISNIDTTPDESYSAKESLKEYIHTNLEGEVLFLNITELPKSTLSDPSKYDEEYYSWHRFQLSFYWNNSDFSGSHTWYATVVKVDSNSVWHVEELGVP